jgi:hypothetical protein
MSYAITRTIELVTDECCRCGIVFGYPKTWWERKQATGDGFYCPNGCSLVLREPDHVKLKKENERLQQSLSAAREEVNLARESTRRTEAKLSRLKKRAANGVCPCCSRTFQNLHRHMKSKHPEFVENPAAAGKQ